MEDTYKEFWMKNKINTNSHHKQFSLWFLLHQTFLASHVSDQLVLFLLEEESAPTLFSIRSTEPPQYSPKLECYQTKK